MSRVDDAVGDADARLLDRVEAIQLLARQRLEHQIVATPEAREPRPRVVVPPEVELRRFELQEPTHRPGRELGDRRDPAQRARVHAEPDELGDIRAEPGAHLVDPRCEHGGERGEGRPGLLWQHHVRRFDVEDACHDAVDLDRHDGLAEDPPGRGDEVRVRADVTDDLDRSRADGASHDPLLQREPVSHFLVPPLRDEPQAIVLDRVHAREQTAPEPIDERLEGDVDRVAPAPTRERLLGGPARALELAAVHHPGGATRRRLWLLRVVRSVLLGCGVANLDGREARTRLGRDRHRLVERFEEEIEHVRIELGAASVAHQPERLFGRHRGPVDAVGRDRVEDVRDGGDPSFQRDRLAAQASVGSRCRRSARDGSRRSSPRRRATPTRSSTGACSRPPCGAPSPCAPRVSAAPPSAGSRPEPRSCRCRGAGWQPGSDRSAPRRAPADGRATRSSGSSARCADPSPRRGTRRRPPVAGSSLRAPASIRAPTGSTAPPCRAAPPRFASAGRSPSGRTGTGARCPARSRRASRSVRVVRSRGSRTRDRAPGDTGR